MKETTIYKVFMVFMALFLCFDLMTLNWFSVITVPFYCFLIYVFGQRINFWAQLRYKFNVKTAKYRK